MLVAVGQITLIDSNDYTYRGTTPPVNPIPNTTMWVDTNYTPNLMKQWNGTAWVQVGVSGNDLTTAINGIQIGGRNLIAKKYITDWGTTITEGSGSDSDGNYLIINQHNLYNNIAKPTQEDIFQGKITFKPNTQYAFKVRWKVSGDMSFQALCFLICYSDSTTTNVYLPAHQTTILESSVITTAGKTVTKISSTYGNINYKTLLYDIQLTEGNKQINGYLVAPEDIQSQLDTITSDNILSADEKPSERQRWDIISAEKAGLDSQATYFGTNSEKADYDSYFQELATYLNGGTTWTSGIPLWLNDLSANTPITGSDYRAKWTDFYTKRTNLVNAIEKKAKDLADSAQATASLAASTAQLALSSAQNAQSTANSKIVAYYQTSAPTSANDNDLWFDTDDSNNLHIRQSGNWVVASDPRIGEAIQSAQTAQTIADGKAKVYYQTLAPTGLTSSDIGDIWIDTDDNCKMYVWKGDGWQLAVDYYGAKLAADTANSRLDEFADDGVITSIEKFILKKEIDTINSEYQIYLNKAATYGLTNTTAYNNYIAGYNNLIQGTTDYHLFDDMYSSSYVDKLGFNSNFTYYYTARANLDKAISDASKTYTDNLKIGGKNYIRNGNFGAGIQNWVVSFQGTPLFLNVSDVYPFATSGLKLACTAGNGVFQDFVNYKLELNKRYVLSCYAKADASNSFNYGHEQSGNNRTVSLTTNWQKFYFSFIPTQNQNIHFYLLNAGTLYLTNVQLEQGDIPSDYKNYSYLEDAMKQSTDMVGGLTLGNVIAARDINGLVRSYMSGLSSIETAFAAGVQNFGASNETKNIDLKHNGAGKIGLFEIDQNGLISIYDLDRNLRLQFINTNLSVLADLLSTTLYKGSVTNSAANGTPSGYTLPNTVTVTQNNSALTFAGTTQLVAQLEDGFETGRIFFRILLLKDGESYVALKDYDIQLDNGGNSYVTINESLSFPLTVLAGVYSIKLITILQNCRYGYAGINNTSILSWNFNRDVNRFEFAKDGFMAFYTNNHMYFKDTDGLDVRGKTNIPGVLLAGEVGVNGGFVSVWGAKTHASKNGEKTATGQYKVWHSIGHSYYQVQITPSSANMSCYIVSKGTDNFVVYFYSIGSNPSLANTGFHFSITGKNYV